MKWAAEKIQAFTDKDIREVLNKEVILNPEYAEKGEEPVIITAEDVEVTTNEIPGFEIAVKGNLTVALDRVLTPLLESEGFAREFINRIQHIRKEQGFELTDKIVLNIEEKAGVKNIITQYNEYICTEILADKIEFKGEIPNGTTIDVNDDSFKVKVVKK